jgi:PAS domain S-box-containing protein
MNEPPVDVVYRGRPLVAFDPTRAFMPRAHPIELPTSLPADIGVDASLPGGRREPSSLINETLVRIGAALSSELDLDVLVQKLTDEATTLCRAQFGAFFYNVVSTTERWALYTLSGVAREHFSKFPMPRMTALFEPTFRGTDVVRIGDVTKDPRYGKSSPHHGMPKGHLPVTSYLAIPVRSRSGEVLGALLFGHREPNVFTETDERLLVAVSAQAAIAIDNAKLFKAARRAEQAAQAERQKLRQLFMQSPAMIVILRGPNHVYEFVNSAAQKRMGVVDGEILGKAVREVPAVPDEHLEVLDEVYRTGERYVSSEVCSSRDWDGTGRPYERVFNVVYEPYRGVDGAVEGIMSFTLEVTDEVLAKRRIVAIVAELETANRMKDDFLATVSHELRTPLNAILGWVRMLRTDSVRPEKRQHALETIERNASVQSQLIEDLLDVSRIITGKLRLDVTTVDLASVVESAVEAVRPAATAKGVVLVHNVAANAGPVIGDPDRLQQVIWNLLANGVKFTPRGGTVSVRVLKQDGLIDIVVADTGQGIAPEFLPHVFERFRQADATTTRKYGGLGLGLAIVRSIVELHGGNARVESRGRGQGTTFIVSLPVSPVRSSRFERPPPLRLAPSLDLGRHSELDGVKILVVDDEPDARELLTELLSACHASVFSAGTVADAMTIIQEQQPDIVVSDIGMPGEDGYDLIRKLRALPPNRGGKTPAVALTAYARIEDRTRALVAGYNMHVPKPVEPTELLSVLSNVTAMFARE